MCTRFMTASPLEWYATAIQAWSRKATRASRVATPHVSHKSNLTYQPVDPQITILFTGTISTHYKNLKNQAKLHVYTDNKRTSYSQAFKVINKPPQC
jgi:hypothetical protein